MKFESKIRDGPKLRNEISVKKLKKAAKEGEKYGIAEKMSGV